MSGVDEETLTTAAEFLAEPAERLDDERPEDQVAECEKSCEDHRALCEATDHALRDLLATDKYLSDLPFDVSPDEVEDQIAVLKGQSITVHVKRESLPTLHVIVPQSTATVLDLKKAIRRTFDLEQKRRRNRELASQKSKRLRHTTNVSWRYIWRAYLLDNGGEPLTDDRQLLFNYGVVNKSIVRFVKRVKVERQRRFR